MKPNFKYIIVQAGGTGSRMDYLCANKPKALLSVNGVPVLIRLMRLYPGAQFLIIGSYKFDVLAQYLKVYAPTKFNLIRARGVATCAGMHKALRFIPAGEPFLITWCDLFYEKPLQIPGRELKDNYLGLSYNFSCRWSFKKGKLHNVYSTKYGVAGVFIFKNKNQITKIPKSGEFCQFLQETQIEFKPFFLHNLKDVGTFERYQTVVNSYPHTRPFNRIDLFDSVVKKIPLDQQGKTLAKYERNWYKQTKNLKLHFVPAVHKINPLILQRIYGQTLIYTKLTQTHKKELFKTIIDNLIKLHQSLSPIKGDFAANNYEAIIAKTKKRLDSVASLIPFMQHKYLWINGKKCLNYYLRWEAVEKTFSQFQTDTYHLIHGDPHFSNIFFENKAGRIYLLDPRGYYGQKILFGDVDYDWAKVYYSLVGNYDQFNEDNWRLTFDGKEIYLEIGSNDWEFLEEDFFSLTAAPKNKIKFFHAIIWVSLTTYIWDKYDSICGAFYNGIYWMNRFYEET